MCRMKASTVVAFVKVSVASSPRSAAQVSSYQVACPSLSQMSLQVAGKTLSPYHWWASSWVMLGAHTPRG